MSFTPAISESLGPDCPLTVGVTTRNRPDSLRRCLDSLQRVSHLLAEVIVVDDASDVPVSDEVGSESFPELPLRIVRQFSQDGYIVARNRMVREATTEAVLLLDDDTVVVDPHAIECALETLRADDGLAAVAFAQGNAEGEPWPATMQPAAVNYPCQTPTYIGFAHLVRRSVFLELGGYRELFQFYGEEKEFALRVLNAGYRIIYLPQCVIAHLADPAGRNLLRYYRSYVRNDCFAALYSLPWSVALSVIGSRLWCYHSTARRHLGLADPEGRQWLLSELRTAWPQIRPDRRPVRYRTLWRWRQLRRRPPVYPLPETVTADVAAHT